MKVMKLALIGTAALAAASVSARADELSDLKAQIEALNARVASVEAAPSVPAGYQAVSFTRNEKGEHVISIMPTADAPAAATIVWSGFVRGGVKTVYGGWGNTNYATDVAGRVGLKVVATTDTAVGEVGVAAALRSTAADVSGNGTAVTAGTGAVAGANNGGNQPFVTDGFRGWWKMTPNLTLNAGVTQSLSRNSYSFDNNCTCWNIDAAGTIGGGAFTNDPMQVNIAYADGPLGFAIGIEDSNNTQGGAAGSSSAVGGTAKATYKTDLIGFDLSGGYWGNAGTKAGTPLVNGESAWVVNAGIGGTFSVLSVGVAAGIGSGFGVTDNYTKVSGYAKAALSDSAGIEVGITHQWNTQNNGNSDWTEFDAGVYYTPVKQLTVGLEGMYIAGGQGAQGAAPNGLSGAGAALGDGAYVGALYTKFAF